MVFLQMFAKTGDNRSHRPISHYRQWQNSSRRPVHVHASTDLIKERLKSSRITPPIKRIEIAMKFRKAERNHDYNLWSLYGMIKSKF